MISRDELLAVFNFRHACKRFDPQRRIADADFAAILEAGRLSPSSYGFEPWQFVVIEDMALRGKLLATVWGAQGQLPTASHFVALLYRKNMRFDAPHVEYMMRDIQQLPEERRAAKLARYRRFQESEHRLLDEPRHLHDWAAKQCYIALGNMMTAAALLGIDSCPIEGFDMDATQAILAEAGVLDPAQFGLAALAAFGYRVDPQPEKTRRPLDEVVRWIR